jgi:hypothetical protein
VGLGFRIVGFGVWGRGVGFWDLVVWVRGSRFRSWGRRSLGLGYRVWVKVFLFFSVFLGGGEILSFGFENLGSG